VAAVISGTTVALALATPFLAVALGNLKSMIEGLQVVLYYPMMYVMAPSNLGVLQKVVMLIVTFEVIPGDLYQKYIWHWTEEEKISPRLDAVGVDSNIFMLSMGLPFYMFAIGCVLLFVALLMNCCVKKIPVEQKEGGQDEAEKGPEPPKKTCEKTLAFRNLMMWNFFVMFFYETSLEISMSVVMGYKYIQNYK